MIITIVSDVLGEENNGTTIAAMDLIRSLRSKGYEVRVVCPDQDRKGQPGYYVVPILDVGPLNGYVKKNGVVIARPDKNIIYEAVKGSDEVHSMLPFAVGREAIKYANDLGIPCSSGFHAQSQNLLAHFFLIHSGLANRLTYKEWWAHYLRHVDAIHYPTQFIRDYFEKRILGHSTNGYVISNGVKPIFRPMDVVRPPELDGKIAILFIGRFSKEKNHACLIKAAGLSKYKDKIQLVFAGEGPLRDKLTKLGSRLPNQPIMGFYNHDELVERINSCDLYVHPSTVEIEAISCLEAMTCGLVPIIDDSPDSATRYFAPGPNNLFANNDARDLAAKIDYWIEHPAEKAACSKQCLAIAANDSFDKCMDQMEAMILETITRFKGKKGSAS